MRRSYRGFLGNSIVCHLALAGKCLRFDVAGGEIALPHIDNPLELATTLLGSRNLKH